MEKYASVFRLTILAALVLLPACGDNSGGSREIRIVSGDGQFGTFPRAPLREELIVEVIESGDPAEGVPVTWTVSSGGGTIGVTSTTLTTDADGRVRVAASPLATGIEANEFTASVDGGGEVTFTASLIARCSRLLTQMDIWSNPAAGADLRPWTNSTLHWIGCSELDPLDCQPPSFECVEDTAAETLSFGTTSMGPEMRAILDVGDVAGDAIPDTRSDCAVEGDGLEAIYNAPDSDSNGQPDDAVTALCKALGFRTATIDFESDINSCPEVHATDASGTVWTSDFVRSGGFGGHYTCSNYK